MPIQNTMCFDCTPPKFNLKTDHMFVAACLTPSLVQELEWVRTQPGPAVVPTTGAGGRAQQNAKTRKDRVFAFVRTPMAAVRLTRAHERHRRKCTRGRTSRSSARLRLIATRVAPAASKSAPRPGKKIIVSRASKDRSCRSLGLVRRREISPSLPMLLLRHLLGEPHRARATLVLSMATTSTAGGCAWWCPGATGSPARMPPPRACCIQSAWPTCELRFGQRPWVDRSHRARGRPSRSRAAARAR